MAGRTPAEAVQNFVEPIQLALSCVTRAVVDVSGGYYTRSEPHALVLNRGEPSQLTGATRIWLSAILHYRIVEFQGPAGPWKVSVAGYLYGLQDSEESEIIAYHWHPAARSSVTAPHAHLGPGAQARRTDLARAHLPTGRIAIEDVIRLSIVSFGVYPLREDWSEVLDRTQEAFEEWRTWP